MPACTTAIINTDAALTDGAFPLIKGWSAGTTNEAVSIAREYRVISRSEIFRAAIFMLSASPRALLSAAVAATMSIPTYAKVALRIVVLGELASAKISTNKVTQAYHIPRNLPRVPLISR
jgi:hypothetical protein